jgi:tight adherence protein B
LDALRAGFDLRESWTAVVRHAPVPLRPEVATLARDLEVTSDPTRPLRSLRQRLADPTTDRVVEALLLASDSGQPGLLLRLLAADLRPDAAAASRRSTTRVSTRAVLAVAAAVPWVCCEFFGEARVPWPDSGTVMGLSLTLFGLALADRVIEGGLSARMWR